MRIREGKNSKILVPLMIASVVIWGIIIYNIITYFTSATDTSLVVEDEVVPVKVDKMNVDESNKLDTMKYEELPRDPFLFEKIVVKPKTAKKNIKPREEKEKSPQIEYQINGIVMNGSSKLAVFKDLTNDKTLFLREGETYSDILIKEISDNKVILVDRKEEKEIIIQ